MADLKRFEVEGLAFAARAARQTPLFPEAH